MSLALYRKYRPATFADVVGQEHVTEPLRTALAAGRVNHAYLFSGPRGCGKTSSARILARSLNCELGPTPDPCGRCPSCIALAPEGPGNIDVIELDAASHGGVDDARELRDRAFYAPAESRYRVFIIDEAHMVTTQGFNALLKIVEEPPEHLVFVFATTEPDKVLPTIRSRTHHYPFRLIPPGTLRALLERICERENVTVAPSAFPLVLRAGGGSARDTLSVLDQLLAGAGPEGVTYERAVALLGVTDVALIDDAVDALAARDGAALFEAVDRLVEAGHDPRRFAADLLDRFRDLILIQAVPDAAGRGLLGAPADELERMTDQANRLGAATLIRYAEIVHTGLTEMRGATAPRLLLELLCGRMLLPAAATSDLALLERLERIERRADIVVEPRPGELGEPEGVPTPSPTGAAPRGGEPSGRTFARRSRADEPNSEPPGVSASSEPGSPAAPAATSSAAASAESPPEPAVAAAPASRAAGDAAPRPATQGAPASIPPEPAAAAPRTPTGGSAGSATGTPGGGSAGSEASASIDAAAVRRAWPEILDTAKRASRSTGALLVNATVRAVEGDTLVLTIAAAPLARRLAEQRNTDVISAALRTVLGVAWQVRCEHDAGGSGQRGVDRGGADRGRADSERGSAIPAGSGAGHGSGQGGGHRSVGDGGTHRSGPDGGPARPAPRDGSAPSGPGGGGEPGEAAASGRLAPGARGRAGSAPPGAPTRARSAPSGAAPSGAAPSGPARRAAGPPGDDEPPLPPEPPPYDDEYDEDMVPDPVDSPERLRAGRRDPEEVAIELLSSQLGARAVDERR